MLSSWLFITFLWSIGSVSGFFSLTVFDSKGKSIGYVGITEDGHLQIVQMEQNKAKFSLSGADNLEIFHGGLYVPTTTDQHKGLRIDVTTSQSQHMIWQMFWYEGGPEYQDTLMELLPLSPGDGTPGANGPADPIVYTCPKLATEERPRVYVDFKTPTRCSQIHFIKREATQ